ncbi:phage tail protein [Mesorhizobium sp.]|uniref:phage tail protein n=1 Tax=Mesorhizobium sp. TaxID=1871066 RepID=UPI00120B2C98|nr:phage tail protein [Mesorhizobium sp.]TJV19678.1 MAG: hypothetical protein E5Y07_00350 [Mesorhizobium sp.]
MAIELHADASDFERLARSIARLPAEIRGKAASRALRRVTGMARTRIVKRSSEHVQLPQSIVRGLTKIAFNPGRDASDVVVRSNWIPLAKIGARQTARGVTVRMRGSYRSAFIAAMGSGHEGVFMRAGKARLPIHELYGPNPAHAVINNPDVYLQVMSDVMESHLLPRYLHEVSNLLPR